jgi:hypothetical protein
MIQEGWQFINDFSVIKEIQASRHDIWDFIFWDSNSLRSDR